MTIQVITGSYVGVNLLESVDTNQFFFLIVDQYS